jgi:hypothetical protein
MSPDYGQRVGQAFQAVCQVFEDTSRLLQDCDGTIGKGRSSLFGNVIIERLSRAIYEPLYWMVSNAVRCYDAGDQLPGLVEAINVYFWDKPPQHDEPLLLLGRIKYLVSADTPVKSVARWWDLWHAGFKWGGALRLGEVVPLPGQALPPEDEGRIEWLKMLAVPLFSVSSIAEVERLMERVRQAGQ